MDSKMIAYEDGDILVLNKPSGLPTVPLRDKGGETLLDIAGSVDKKTLGAFGKNQWEGGAIHRLDTLTSGLVVFAKNQDSYDFLQSEQLNGDIWKTYYAKTEDRREGVDGFPEFPYESAIETSGIIRSYFRPYGKGRKSVRPALKEYESPKIYSTEVINRSNGVFSCTIALGFRHQIRAHLAWAGHPVWGDVLYGGKERDEFGLCAYEISFRRVKDGRLIGIRASSEAPFL